MWFRAVLVAITLHPAGSLTLAGTPLLIWVLPTVLAAEPQAGIDRLAVAVWGLWELSLRQHSRLHHDSTGARKGPGATLQGLRSDGEALCCSRQVDST